MAQPEKRIKIGACVATIFAKDISTAEGTKVMRSVVLKSEQGVAALAS